MGNDVFSILEACATIGVGFWLVGFCMLLMAVRKGRREFRVKGFLRIPSGTRWFRFLMFKHYNAFDNPSTRFYFGIVHFCLMGLIIVLMAVTVLLSSEFFFKSLYGMPDLYVPRDTGPSK